MPIKVENRASVKVPKNTEEIIQSAFDAVPIEHMRGLTRVVLVDRIAADPRIAAMTSINMADMPGIYHPRVGTTQPFFEVAMETLLSSDSFFKRLAARMNFKPSLAYLIFSLQAQHYYMTLSHGIKKNQYDGAIKVYIERYHSVWREKQSGWRVKLLKPLRPYLDKWMKKLQKKYIEEQKKKKKGAA
jgi:hypothetical protein